ncbi:hypothetical protein U9M48_043215 [Paspalum notatum var. saurae]|uniref:Reverse transcriptase Ty1/copia-type domain-containing protein n=1 Tax=Paspalum notatum var. saurae TaxID=547442 RepID=A0AAQ3XFD0_PASNO
MEEGGLAEYVCAHPCFVDVFPVETMRAPYTAVNKGYDLLPNRDHILVPLWKLGRFTMSMNEHLDADVDGKLVDQSTYRSMIGSLLYLTASRPDIMFSVCLCARFQATPKESHLTAVKRILRYLKHNPKLLGYSDSDFAGYRVDHKSTSGGCHLLGKKQNYVALSTAEAEYIAASACCAQILYMKQSLLDFGVVCGSVPLLCDNESAAKIAKNPIQHSRTKHIDIRHHFLRDHEARGDITITGVRSEEQLADIFTKPLGEETFCRRLQSCLPRALRRLWEKRRKAFAKALVKRLSKALYGLKQAPRAWYERLRDFLIEKGFKIGQVDTTLFTKKMDNDLFVCQVYVDDIIFGSTNEELSKEFGNMMAKEFEMSMIGELTFFLGFQIKQLKEGTFIYQEKYTRDLLKRLKMDDCKPIETPMATNAKLEANIGP